ncbi:MAG TPA: MBL fold metallo-hydrolase [Candidatus Angelobacter sp.]|jgi:glyoxylase-like metal-dependent hydrolase (beta-lactamase superfamily II)|nr:MBL fold metallo-hydrolase [Candidatus Angelobacter sp.]
MRTRTTALLLVLICLSTCAVCADTADFTVKKIGEGIYAAIGADGGKAGSNAGFIVGSNGVVVVDTFEAVGPARDLLAEIRKITDLPIRFVVNTHYHLDHTGGNAVFAQAGATILAQRNLRGWLRTENLKFFGPNPKPEQKAMVEALVLPDEVYSDAVDIYLGARQIQVRYMLGHTGGDSVVTVPDAGVIFAGDLVWQKHLPNLIDATTSDWVKTLEKLLAEHPSGTFVSGHGDVATAADVRDFHDYLVTLRDAIAKAQAAGKTDQALLDAVLPQLQEKYGKDCAAASANQPPAAPTSSCWGFFKAFSTRNITQTAAELAGTKRVPAAVADPNKNVAGK